MKKTYEAEKFLIEMGTSLNRFYDLEEIESNPVDLIVLVVFKGIVNFEI